MVPRLFLFQQSGGEDETGIHRAVHAAVGGAPVLVVSQAAFAVPDAPFGQADVVLGVRFVRRAFVGPGVLGVDIFLGDEERLQVFLEQRLPLAACPAPLAHPQVGCLQFLQISPPTASQVLLRRRTIRGSLTEWCRHCGYEPALYHGLGIRRSGPSC